MGSTYMKMMPVTKFAFVCLALVASVAAYEKDGDVLVLGDKTLADAIKENEFLLVEFYAPWCGHCKNLAPEYAKAATELAAKDPPISIAKVDATEESAVAEEYEVRGYPTLKWFVNGEASEYTGGRTADEIVQWVVKKTGPPCKELADDAAVEAFKGEADVVVVGFLETSSEEFKTLEAVARSNDDVLFGVAPASGADAGKVVLFKTFDEGKNVFEGGDADALKEFISGNAVPLVSTFTQETASRIFGSGIDNHFLYFNSPEADSHAGIMDAIKEAATEFKGKSLCVFVPAEEERVLEYFDFSADDLPKAVLVSLGEGDMKKFGFDKDITAANVKAHLTAFHSGELKPTLKSEEPPTPNDAPVTVVVGTTFDEIVMDDSKDVLVEFYAPWCGHCKALAPAYDELGQLYASDELSKLVTIAKVDATLNDVPDEIQGFPTIKLFPAGKKDAPIDYSGSRTVEDLVQFIKENGSHKAEAAAPDSAASAASEATKSVKSAASEVTDSASSAAS